MPEVLDTAPALPDGIPVLEEDAGQAAHRLTGQAYARVEPVPVGMRDVKVLLSQIVTAGKADFSVDHRNFPVVPVIQERIEKRRHRIKDSRADAGRLHAPDKIVVDEPDAADVVVEEPDFHTACRLLYKDFLQLPEGDPVLDRVVLHEDETLCLFERLQLRRKGFLRSRIKTDVGVAVHRIAEPVREVAELVCDAVVHRFEFL